MIFLRNTSFGPEYNLSIKDPETNKPFETSILLDELNIKKDFSKKHLGSLSSCGPNMDGARKVALSEHTILEILLGHEIDSLGFHIRL